MPADDAVEGNVDVDRSDQDENIQFDSTGWSRTYGGSMDDRAWVVAPTPGDGYFVAGWTISFGSIDTDIWVLKIDENGGIIWEKRYGGPESESPSAAYALPGGELLVAASTSSFGSGDYDIWLLMIDADGGIVWQKTYGGPREEVSSYIDLAHDGLFVVVGTAGSFSPWASHCWVLVVDEDGNIAAENVYGTPPIGLRSCSYISRTSDGGYIVAGTGMETTDNLHDMGIAKLHSDWTIGWQYVIGTELLEEAFFVRETSDGGYMAFANSCETGMLNCDILIVKMDWHGILEWSKTYGDLYDDKGYFALQIRDGGFAITGSTRSTGSGRTTGMVLRITEEAEVVFQKGFDGSGSAIDWGGWISLTDDEGFIVAAHSDFYGSGGNDDFWIIRSDMNGNVSEGCPDGIGKDIYLRMGSADVLQQELSWYMEGTNAAIVETGIIPAATAAVIEKQCGE